MKYIFVLFALLLSGCTQKESTIGILKNEGYTDIQITGYALVFTSLVLFVGFFMGWLVGHMRNNAIQCDVMNDLEAAKSELNHVKWQLKNSTDHEAFLDHENSVLNKELDRRQHIINAYKIGGKYESNT